MGWIICWVLVDMEVRLGTSIQLLVRIVLHRRTLISSEDSLIRNHYVMVHWSRGHS